MATKIDTVTARTRLKPRREPFWHRVSKGNYLGYRKMTADTAGTWTARALDETTGKQAYKSLGDFSDLPDHQRFDAALKAAQAWSTIWAGEGAPQPPPSAPSAAGTSRTCAPQRPIARPTTRKPGSRATC